MILKCSCVHEAQDRLHGSGNRVHNQTKTEGGAVRGRCTICKTEHDKPAVAQFQPQPQTKKKK